MAERLTNKDYFAWHYCCGYQNKKDSLERTQKEHKLGKLEDILEKYGVDIQNLDYILEDYSKNQGRDFAIQELEKVKEDCFNQKELVDFGNVAYFMVDIVDILEIINNQIKELKGE